MGASRPQWGHMVEEDEGMAAGVKTRLRQGFLGAGKLAPACAAD